MAMSGVGDRAAASASRPFAVSATISRFGWASSNVRRPRRTILWSSAMRTFLIGRDMGPPGNGLDALRYTDADPPRLETFRIVLLDPLLWLTTNILIQIKQTVFSMFSQPNRV